MIKREKIGIAGGSYNPIHLAHLIIIERFREQLNLDKVIIVPANISPFKQNSQNKYISNNYRKSIIEQAIQDNSYLELDTFELDKDGVSFTIDTLYYLKRKYVNAELYLLIGEDQAINFNKWHRWEEIAKETQICVAARNTIKFEIEKINDIFRKINKNVLIIDSPIIEISSTEIRNRIKEGKEIKYLVTEKVEKYIKENELYK